MKWRVCVCFWVFRFLFFCFCCFCWRRLYRANWVNVAALSQCEDAAGGILYTQFRTFLDNIFSTTAPVKRRLLLLRAELWNVLFIGCSAPLLSLVVHFETHNELPHFCAPSYSFVLFLRQCCQVWTFCFISCSVCRTWLSAWCIDCTLVTSTIKPSTVLSELDSAYYTCFKVDILGCIVLFRFRLRPSPDDADIRWSQGSWAKFTILVTVSGNRGASATIRAL